MTAKQYFWNLLIAADQFANTVLAGDPDETISARVARNRTRGVYRVVAWVIEFFAPGHLDASLFKRWP